MPDDESPLQPRRAADADPAATAGEGAHPAAPRRRRRWPKVLLAVVLVLALVAAALGYGYYRHLNRNITSVDLPSDVQASSSPGAQLSGLPKGVAQNIVVIGTDSRQSAEDCKIGGSCGKAKLDGDTNADVEMLVHISADHTSMSVLSIPRDTVVDLPACTGNGKTRAAGRGQINGTLNYGLDCTLRALHELSGLPVSHFAMVDFSGVISLSDAVGGVDVCVDNNVYDPYSHLKLTKGEHSLQGMAALQFLRTRHGFGDGSDLGRTIGQHLFLSSLQRNLESAGTLLNPQKVYRLAEAATQALTVDKGLGDVATLAQVATTVGNIPASSTVFLTLPTVPDPQDSNRVVPAASAKTIFAKLAADQPLVKTPKASASASGSASGSASASASASASGSASASSSASASTSSAAASATASSLNEAAHDGTAQVSSQATGCAPVSSQDTVSINGVPMSPIEAFDASPKIALSAP